MMRHRTIAILALAALMGAMSPGRVEAATPRPQYVADFKARQAALPHGDLFSVFDSTMTAVERSDMEFLYAYMPTCDIADYPSTFFLSQVRAARHARSVVGWAVPDDVYRHFVLPVRVNNENLDSFRSAMQGELLERVRGKSLYDAVLEVNHWCHEKVNYQPSDARTSSPLATVRTSWGRCGEESTLLVAALRAVCIPARQVYTPRWAHTDDNHAWVEAWVDGKWLFMGACEPEPVLNLGWFNAPASRGMLMHTKVFGRYAGPELVMSRTPYYTEINVTANYAPTAPMTVTITDAHGRPLQGARVEFRIYNYAEFFPVASLLTAADGRASFTAGLGDMLVIAAKADRLGWARVRFGQQSSATIALIHRVGDRVEEDIDIIPPVEHANMPPVTAAQRAENTRRMAAEDSVRAIYRATFRQGTDSARALMGADAAAYVAKAEGNWPTILHFLRGAQATARLPRAMALLSTLTDKDLRDVTPAVLADAMDYTADTAQVAHVLAPRVADEQLVPYRAALCRMAAPVLGKGWGSPVATLGYCRKHIALTAEPVAAGTYTSPLGVWRSRVADERSMAVFFVALCRTQGIPAWVDPVTGRTYYEWGGRRVQVEWGSDGSATPVSSQLRLHFSAKPHLAAPEYYTHYTLSRWGGHDLFTLLNYDDARQCQALLDGSAPVAQGYYLLTTGTRLASGSVRAHISLFPVGPQPAEATIKLPDAGTAVSVIGSFDSEGRFTDAATGRASSVLLSAGRGYYVVGLLGVGQEPTNHALRDIAQRASQLEAWGRRILLLFPTAEDYAKYLASPIQGLPSTVQWGIDTGGAIAADLSARMKQPATTSLPRFIIGDTFNRVVFESHGYTIGLGDQLLKTIHGL